MASSIAMDKIRSKQIMMGVGLPTAPFVVLKEDFDVEEVVNKLGLPIFVKPSRQGSSYGATKVTEASQLQQAWLDAYEYDHVVIAEKFIDGPELTIGILDGEALPVIRIETSHECYDFDAKYVDDSTQYHIPSGLSEREEKELQSLAVRVYETIGCSGWGRVDAMQGKDGKFWLLEVNTIPGLTSHSLVPKAAQSIGIGFDELMMRILGTV